MLNLYKVISGQFVSISSIGEISSPFVLFVMGCILEITLEYNWLSLSADCEFLCYFSTSRQSVWHTVIFPYLSI